MRNTRSAILVATLAVAVSAVALTAQTTSVSSGGITLTYPAFPVTGPALVSCEPGQDSRASVVTLNGIPQGANVTVTFAWSPPTSGSPTFLPSLNFSNVQAGTLVVPVSYPAETSLWPVVDPATNERAIAVAVMVHVSWNGTSVKLSSRKWWIRCPALPDPPFAGCTPGYWRQQHHFDSWSGYTPGQSFGAVFGVAPSFSPSTLLDAVWLGGGGENALARHAVAALLNAAHPTVGYAYSVHQVISMVQAAYAPGGDIEGTKNSFEFANEAGCPLN